MGGCWRVGRGEVFTLASDMATTQPSLPQRERNEEERSTSPSHLPVPKFKLCKNQHPARAHPHCSRPLRPRHTASPRRISGLRRLRLPAAVGAAAPAAAGGSSPC